MDILYNYLAFFLISSRNFLYKNYLVDIDAIIKYNKFDISIYDCNNYYFKCIYLPFRIIPFSIICYIMNKFDIYIIYNTDSLYKISSQKVVIIPIILKSSVLTNDNEEIVISFKKFSPLIPIKFILQHLSINTNNYEILYIKYMYKGNILEKKININILNKKLSLSDLFT